jgi:hypothetical protein
LRIYRNILLCSFIHIVISIKGFSMSNRFQRILYFILLLYLHQPLIAQEEEAKENTGLQNRETLIEFSANWVPSLLSASSLPIYNLSQFNGFVFSWVPRGQSSNRGSYIDGINWCLGFIQ